MVSIVDYKSFKKENGEMFFGLTVQGGVEAIKSKSTGKMYLTAKTAFVPTTFNEQTCVSLIGTTLDGLVKKVECDPYEYTVKETGEQVELSHRYEYLTDESEIIQKNVMEEELVL